jgi:hypothetical protein
MKIGKAGVTQVIDDSTHIPGGHPQEGTKMGLLGRGSLPPRLDKEDPTITTMATAIADKHDKTYEIPSR